MRRSSRLQFAFALAVALAAAPTVAGAAGSATIDRRQAPHSIIVGDAPGTNRRWQQARATIDAPAAVVREWLFDAARWPERFRDVVSTTVLARTAKSERVRMRSRLAGRDLTLEIVATRAGLFSRGRGRHVTTEGRIYITPLGPSRTDVVMQTTAEVHGFIGLFAPQSTVRDRSRRRLVSDLTDLQRLARERNATSVR